MIAKFGDGRDWFFEKRFGMFVHWGLYALNGVHEQELWRYALDPAAYAQLQYRFDPRAFNPRQWLDMFQENGMEYLVFTTKHHDGFCMFGSRLTDYNILNTPYKKDIFGMLAEECHKRNFPLVAYYSVLDWHHPAYPNTGDTHEIHTDPAAHDMSAYMEYMTGQLRELCSNYGTIHGIWFDLNSKLYQHAGIAAMIRELQPCAVINNRGTEPGDFSTPERVLPAGDVYQTPTEACESVGHYSWGYRKEEVYYTPAYLKHNIAVNLACGGNFLLNAGPDGDGRFCREAKNILRKVGSWYQLAREGLTAPGCGALARFPSIYQTGTGDTRYLILAGEVPCSDLELAGYPDLLSAESLTHPGDRLDVSNEDVYKIDFFPHAPRIRGILNRPGEVQVLKIRCRNRKEQPR